MTFRVELTSSAAKECDALSPQMRDRVLKKIGALGEKPFPPGCLKLSGTFEGYRLRVGDWRVFYTVEQSNRVLTVYAIKHRSKAYK